MLPLPPATSVRAVALPPAMPAITGTRQDSGLRAGWSRENSPWVSATVMLPPLHTGSATRISGTPGCSVKSRAIAVTGLAAARSTWRHRSLDAVLP